MLILKWRIVFWEKVDALARWKRRIKAVSRKKMVKKSETVSELSFWEKEVRIPRSKLKLAGNIEHSGKYFLIYINKKGIRKDVVCSEDDTVNKS